MELIGIAAHLQTHVMREEGIVIMTLIVLEALNVGTTTVEEIIPCRVLTGLFLPIAVQVHDISNLLILY